MNFLWPEIPVTKGRKQYFNPRPNVPDTGWIRPKNFPDLSGAGAISLDVESYDPELKTHGAGWGRGKGHIVGLAIATDDGFKAYYPVRHEECAELNFPPEQVFDWAREQLSRPYQFKVAHNSLYDIGFLLTENVRVEGPIWDTWIAERLIHHQNEASLEETGQRRIGKGKKASELLRWLFLYFGRGPAPSNDEDLDEAMKAFIYKSPPQLAGPYAEMDVELPLEIAGVQEELLLKLGLDPVYEMENALTPLLADIRFKGVAVNIQAAARADETLTSEMEQLHAEIQHIAGRQVEVNSGEDVGKLLTSLGVKVPLTPKTKKFSVTDDLLEEVDLPVAERILEVRKLIKFQSTFIRGAILNSHIKGRVHCNFNPLQAITGRFSSSAPNLQNLPSRNPRLAPMVRGIFVPEGGHSHMVKLDYSSIESRLLAHFAVGKNAEELREEYRNNPKTDYHNFTTALVKKETGLELPRKSIKNVNFAIIYGASENKLARMLKLSKSETEPFFNAYNSGMPYVRATMEHFSRETACRGYTQTIMGRRVEFSEWEPSFWQGNEATRRAYPLEEAVRLFGTRIRRAYLHCAVNYTIQGSAADLFKSAMLQCWKDGIYSVTGNPLLLVHDEFVHSSPDDSPSTRTAFREMKRIMETVLQFNVPILVSTEKGENWGTTKEFDLRRVSGKRKSTTSS